MKRLSKFMIASVSVLAMTAGTALAQGEEGGGEGGGDTGGDTGGGDTGGGDTGGGDMGGGGDTSGGGDMGGGGGEMAPAGKTKTIGADGVFVLPLGDYADAADAAIGALGRFEFGLKPELAITARVGFLYNLAKADGISIIMIPVFVGGKYKIGTSGLFAFGELGVNHTRISIDGGGSDSETKFHFQAGAGYQMGKLQARAGFWYVASDPALTGIMASVGYDFATM